MKKLLLPILFLFLAFTSCDSDDIKEIAPEPTPEVIPEPIPELTEEQKQALLEQGDVNGEYLLTAVFEGDIKIVECIYNDDNKITLISNYSNDDYETVLDYTLTKEYNGEGHVSKISVSSIEETGSTRYTYLDYIDLEYDSKGNAIKASRFYMEDRVALKSAVVEEDHLFFINTYNSQNQLIKSEMFEFNEGVETKYPSYLKYEYNSLGLRTQVTEVNGEGDEKVLSNVKYDEKGNPIEIFTYTSAEYDWNKDFTEQILISEAGLSSVVTIQYDYTKKNFLKHTLALLFPEVSKFEMHNAPISIKSSTGKSAGSITYHDFNDGGYPELIKYLGNDEEDKAYNGEFILEFTKKK